MQHLESSSPDSPRSGELLSHEHPATSIPPPSSPDLRPSIGCAYGHNRKILFAQTCVRGPCSVFRVPSSGPHRSLGSRVDLVCSFSLFSLASSRPVFHHSTLPFFQTPRSPLNSH